MGVPYLMKVPDKPAPNPAASLRDFRNRSCRVPSRIVPDKFKLTSCTMTTIDVSTHTRVFACSFSKTGILVLDFLVRYLSTLGLVMAFLQMDSRLIIIKSHVGKSVHREFAFWWENLIVGALSGERRQ